MKRRQINEARRLARMLLEQEYSYSTTQIDIPDPLGDFLLKWGRMNIPDHDLYYFDDGGGGRETEPHITVLYGLLEPTPSEELREIVRGTKPFTIALGPISFFEQDDHDVVKFTVISEPLKQLSDAIRLACPNENKYPKYIPHATVAYAKKGRVDHLKGVMPFEGYPPVPNEFEATRLTFNAAGDGDDPKRKKSHLSFNRTKNESVEPFKDLWFPAEPSELASKILGLKRQPGKTFV
jgi:hypothetical protein